ncbi:nitrogen fixation protein NifQ [Stutzerimonas tarimensis]|uniref:Nitrogen fixation protein NifQ n=1 Tax=Stutzerimonas tarimensis TaxID=1507735 RepID=A0ABV7T684_9GAMM
MSGQALVRGDAMPVEGRQGVNAAWLGEILQAQRQGRTCLPLLLGLSQEEFDSRVGPLACTSTALAPDREKDVLRQELLDLRRDEWSELRALLLAGRAGNDPDEAVMASVVSAACLGGDHLWRDLGLPSRLELHALLTHNFPLLASRNLNNMRWKKFFYKQLCEQDGGYVCRSPSCEQCPTYHDCFGEES